MRLLVTATIVCCVTAAPVRAQTPSSSHWGVVGGLAPKWENTSTFEPLAKLVFDEDAVGLLEGSEFRIGIARGRRLSGDWGVSFIRKHIDDREPTTVQDGRSCQGTGTAPGAPLVVNCELMLSVRTPEALRMLGVEVHKYIAFVTIRERVQIGLNVAGGVAQGQGRFSTERFTTSFTCTFAPDQVPDFSGDDPCGGGVQGPDTSTPPVPGETEPFTRLLNYDRNTIPIGKIEIAGTVILTPRIKIRLGGGMNFPGQTTIGVTGLYFFGSD